MHYIESTEKQGYQNAIYLANGKTKNHIMQYVDTITIPIHTANLTSSPSPRSPKRIAEDCKSSKRVATGQSQYERTRTHQPRIQSTTLLAQQWLASPDPSQITMSTSSVNSVDQHHVFLPRSLLRRSLKSPRKKNFTKRHRRHKFLIPTKRLNY